MIIIVTRKNKSNTKKIIKNKERCVIIFLICVKCKSLSKNIYPTLGSTYLSIFPECSSFVYQLITFVFLVKPQKGGSSSTLISEDDEAHPHRC